MEIRAEAAAQLKHMGGTHAVRRKWVSERKGHTIKDIMVAGGWNDPRALDACMQDDEKTTCEVVSRPTRRIGAPVHLGLRSNRDAAGREPVWTQTP
jgi:hypothetical protein